MSVIVISFLTLDGVVADPDGSGGTPRGGWMFRYGRHVVDGDKFRLGRTLDEGVLLLGRRTWQVFAERWPARAGEFAARMNAAPKLVATRGSLDVSAWANSSVIEGDAVASVKAEQRDVIVIGSTGLVRQLAAADLVDEYRLITVPTVLGEGEPLFGDGAAYAEFECVAAEPVGALAYACYRRAAAA